MSASPNARLRVALQRAHSLSGVFPLGVFLALYLLTYGAAGSGEAALGDALARFDALPARRAWQLAVLVPLAYHAAFGLWRTVRGRYAVVREPTARNWSYTVQRITGVLALAFIGYHLATVWWPMETAGTPAAAVHGMLVAHLSHTTAGIPWRGMVYLVGLAACCLHLANGLVAFGKTWGLAVSGTARRVAAVLGAVVGVVLFVVSARATIFLATGDLLFGEAPAEPALELCTPPEASAAEPEP